MVGTAGVALNVFVLEWNWNLNVYLGFGCSLLALWLWSKTRHFQNTGNNSYDLVNWFVGDKTEDSRPLPRPLMLPHDSYLSLVEALFRSNGLCQR